MEYIVKAQEYVKDLESRLKKLEEESLEKDEILKRLKSGEKVLTAEVVEEPTAEEIADILDELNLALSKDNILEKAKAAVQATALVLGNISKDDATRMKIQAADNVVVDARKQICSARGFSEHDSILEKARALLTGSSATEELRDRIEEALTTFSEIEERVVIVAAMGEEAYHRQQSDQADLEAAMAEVKEALFSGDVASRQAYVTEINKQAIAIMNSKLRVARTREEMDAIFETLSPEERLAVFKAQSISQILGVQGGSHSHNGQPCHGHGGHDHDHGGHQHGGHQHSHGGQPCGGHGHSHGMDEDEEEEYDEFEEEEEHHGHSHDDHGHSHDDHGHSHDDHGHSHDHHGHSHDHHGHSHDHHGHSH